MCCLFTVCSWCLDVVQRCWTFAMGCLVSCAVVCLLLVGSSAGVALGYNYSLSEFIDLKDTNVSVFIKRGIFDDSVAEEMDWRRSGNRPGNVDDDNADVITSHYDDNGYFREASRRRLDDSIFKSNEKQSYEGSLIKFTALPLHIMPSEVILDDRAFTVENPSEIRSLDHLKALQAMVNLRKANIKKLSYPVGKTKLPTFNPYPTDENGNILPVDPGMLPKPNEQMDPNEIPGNSHRYAVPIGINGDRIDRRKWMNPRLPEQYQVTAEIEYPGQRLDEPFRYPSPVTPRVIPIRPSAPPPTKTLSMTTTQTEPVNNYIYNKQISIVQPQEERVLFTGYKAAEADKIIADINKQGLLLSPEDDSSKQIDEISEPDPEDYEVEVSGIPRKKRSMNYPENRDLYHNFADDDTTDVKQYSTHRNKTNITSEDYATNDVTNSNSNIERVKKLLGRIIARLFNTRNIKINEVPAAETMKISNVKSITFKNILQNNSRLALGKSKGFVRTRSLYTNNQSILLQRLSTSS